jgi:FlaG/FlaF family flagellin (archaellin)
MLKLKRRKGISTFIAALLMILLTVAAGVVVSAYTMGYLGGFSGSPPTGALSLDISVANSTKITAHIRNVGQTTIQIDKVYIDGVEYSTFTQTPTSTTQGEVAKVVITGAFTPSKTYQVKFVAKDNTQLSFSVIVK